MYDLQLARSRGHELQRPVVPDLRITFTSPPEYSEDIRASYTRARIITGSHGTEESNAGHFDHGREHGFRPTVPATV